MINNIQSIVPPLRGGTIVAKGGTAPDKYKASLGTPQSSLGASRPISKSKGEEVTPLRSPYSTESQSSNLCRPLSNIRFKSNIQNQIEDNISQYLKSIGEDEMNISLNPELFSFIFEQYDSLVFNNKITDALDQLDKDIYFEVTQHPNHIGYCSEFDDFFVMQFSGRLLGSTFSRGEKTHLIGGVICDTKILCLLKVFEHELIHLAMLIFCPNSFQTNYNPNIEGNMDSTVGYHGFLFQDLTNNIFNHSDTIHMIEAGEGEILLENIKKFNNLKLGDCIYATPLKNNRTNPLYYGKIEFIDDIELIIYGEDLDTGKIGLFSVPKIWYIELVDCVE